MRLTPAQRAENERYLQMMKDREEANLTKAREHFAAFWKKPYAELKVKTVRPEKAKETGKNAKRKVRR